MARYIDADKLEKEGWMLHRTYQKDLRTSCYEAKCISDVPSADVRENVHGNWVGIDDEPCETFECDKCGFVLDDWIQGALYNFCPNCGADMRRKDAPGD